MKPWGDEFARSWPINLGSSQGYGRFPVACFRSMHVGFLPEGREAHLSLNGNEGCTAERY
jgi:hypothetical protein